MSASVTTPYKTPMKRGNRESAISSEPMEKHTFVPATPVSANNNDSELYCSAQTVPQTPQEQMPSLHWCATKTNLKFKLDAEPGNEHNDDDLRIPETPRSAYEAHSTKHEIGLPRPHMVKVKHNENGLDRLELEKDRQDKAIDEECLSTFPAVSFGSVGSCSVYTIHTERATEGCSEKDLNGDCFDFSMEHRAVTKEATGSHVDESIRSKAPVANHVEFNTLSPVDSSSNLTGNPLSLSLWSPSSPVSSSTSAYPFPSTKKAREGDRRKTKKVKSDEEVANKKAKETVELLTGVEMLCMNFDHIETYPSSSLLLPTLSVSPTQTETEKKKSLGNEINLTAIPAEEDDPLLSPQLSSAIAKAHLKESQDSYSQQQNKERQVLSERKEPANQEHDAKENQKSPKDQAEGPAILEVNAAVEELQHDYGQREDAAFPSTPYPHMSSSKHIDTESQDEEHCEDKEMNWNLRLEGIARNKAAERAETEKLPSPSKGIAEYAKFHPNISAKTTLVYKKVFSSIAISFVLWSSVII